MLSNSSASTDIEGWSTTNSDDLWRICTTQSATLPRTFHSSTILRRRYMGGPDTHSVVDGAGLALIGSDEFPYSPPSSIYQEQGYSYSASGLLPAPPPLTKVLAKHGSAMPAFLASQSIRMSMPADMGDRLSDFLLPFSTSASSDTHEEGQFPRNNGTVAASAHASTAAGLPLLHASQQQQQQQQHKMGESGSGIFGSLAEGNMLHALLSRLPEPPVSCPNNSSVASLTALADSLPIPPRQEDELNGLLFSPPPSSPSLSLSSSVDSTDSATSTIETLPPQIIPLLSLDTCTHASEPPHLSSGASEEGIRSATVGQKQRSSAAAAVDANQEARAVDTERRMHTARATGTGLTGLLAKDVPVIDVTGIIVAPETPASSRRNTDEVSLSKQHRDQLQIIESAAGSAKAADSTPIMATLLDAEMPPSESPFFENISRADIETASLSVRQRATWCCASASTYPKARRARASMAVGLPHAWTEEGPVGCETLEEEQLANQTPPVSPHFAQSTRPSSPSASRQDGGDEQRHPARLLQVDVHGLFASPLSRKCNRCRQQRVVLSEVSSDPPCRIASDFDVLKGLQVSRTMRRALLAGSRTTERCKVSTGMRQPSCHCGAQTKGSCLKDLLGVSVVASTAPPAPPLPADKRVRALDIEAMVAAHLPHVYSKFRKFLGDSEEDEAASDAAIAAEPPTRPLSSDDMESRSNNPNDGKGASAVRRPPLCSARTSATRISAPLLSLGGNQQPKAAGGSSSQLPMPPPGLRLPGRRSDAGIVTTATRIPLSATEGSSGLRRPWNGGARQRLSTPPSLDLQRSQRSEENASYHTAPILRRSVQPLTAGRTLVPRPSVSRRRSEVQALISQANAVLGNSFTPISRLRPPRASLPLSFTEPPSAARPTQSLRYSMVSPRTSLLSPSSSLRESRHLSCLSESEPALNLAVRRSSPPASLSAALSRQQHRLESARGDLPSPSSGDVSPLSLTPVRSLNSDVFASCRTARGMRASVSFSSGSVGSSSSTRIPIIRNNSNGGSGLRRLPSSGRLRPVGASGRATSDDCNSSNGSISSLARRVTVNQGRRVAAAAAAAAAVVSNGSSDMEQDYEFLTLRPVHTPDLVPCTIDPRLIERAMTPMLKTNAGGAKQQPRSLAHALVGSLVGSMEAVSQTVLDPAGMEPLSPQSDDRAASTRGPSTEAEPRVSGFSAGTSPSLLARDSTATLEGKSRISPLNSPELNVEQPLRRRSFGTGRFTMPGGLFSRSKKNSPKPVSAVSAIPMPPAAKPSAKKRSSGGSPGLSNIPSLSKAKSLWSLRAGNAIASSLYFSKK
ncbi:hypothetical protein LPJ74_001970 [Coemansia sp. RSA 1843]|nr:hypothetical protein LPJ74_001970 [Coemansia sp. RSA 1843]